MLTTTYVQDILGNHAIVIEHALPRGVGASINEAVDTCTSPYVYIHSVHTTLHASVVEKAAWFLQAHPNVDIVGANMVRD